MAIPTSTTPLRTILEFYVATISIQKRGYKAETYRIRPLSEKLGHLTLSEIKPMHVAAYRDERLITPHPKNPEETLGTSTVRLELMLLSNVYSIAITEWGMDELSNPVLKIKKPKPAPGRTRRLTTVEEKKLLRAAIRHSNREFYALVVIALESAMRQGELLSMRWENVYWSKRTVLLPTTKNGDIREVPLSRKAYAILSEHLTPQREGKIFSYTANGFKSSWRVFIQSIEIDDFHFHDLRRCAISSLLERGLNTMEVSAISGHKSMAMLKRYSNLNAYKLVEKLDPKPKRKKDRPILAEHLQSYPAIISKSSQHIAIDFPDFVEISTVGIEINETIDQARNKLLRKIVKLLCEGQTPPSPSLPSTLWVMPSNSHIEMLSPL